MPRDAMLPATLSPAAGALPVLYAHAPFKEPFECFLCRRMTRPPKAKKTDPGMSNTLSYGGRGCCNTCYAGRNDPDKQARLEAQKAAELAYTRQSLDGYLRRRRERLMAGAVPVVQTRQGSLRRVRADSVEHDRLGLAA